MVGREGSVKGYRTREQPNNQNYMVVAGTKGKEGGRRYTKARGVVGW